MSRTSERVLPPSWAIGSAMIGEQFGYDLKHAFHLICLLRMASEFLETGEMHVDRTNIDAEHLKAIKRGGWPRGRGVREAESLFIRL
jgi:hypothetical protein